jgi:hypothetical protein
MSNLRKQCYKFLYFVFYSEIVPKIGIFLPNPFGLGSGCGFTAGKVSLPRQKFTFIQLASNFDLGSDNKWRCS